MNKSESRSLLAIVIPYYKLDFIKETLKSIQQQTDKRFVLYIGDDNSPFSLQSHIDDIAKDFANAFHYVKFSNNLGSVSLTKQWERCIDITDNEPYIWLFSDDDIMPQDAVERFYRLIDKEVNIDVSRFNVEIIDHKGILIGKSLPHPSFETAEEFIKRRLAGKCISTACEYIFSRKIYKEKNGFVDLPLAWAADDATWAIYAEEDGIYTMPGKPVSWRMSGQNISSDTGKTFEKKVEASILFIQFISKKFSVTKKEKLTWLQRQLNLMNPTISKKKYFYKQILKSALFSRSFIAGFLITQTAGNCFKRLTKKINLNNR